MLLGVVSCILVWENLEKLGGVCTFVVLPCAPGEDLQEGKVAGVFGGGVGGPERLDCWGVEELGEYVGVWAGGRVGD